MHFLELLEQVSDRATAVYYARNCGLIPTRQQSAHETLAHKLISFDWELSPQGCAFWDDLCGKLRQHPFDYFVTYEPEVYLQYKNEIFDNVDLEDDIKVGAQYTNTTGVICTIWEVNAGSEFDNVIRYKTPKSSGATNRNNIRKNWKLLVAPTIKVGEVYTNSAGYRCVITEINANGSIRYLHKDGNYYTIGANVIASNWTKKPTSIENYAIHITDTSLENRLKVKDILAESKEPIFWGSRAFTEKHIYDRAYLARLSHAWIVEDEEDVRKNKTIVTIEEFIDLFGTKQEPEKTEAEPILEVLEEKSETTTKTTKKETFMSKLKTTALNTLEQNKQAAIIAAKVDAGRIINKQVIKQLKPHVPMLLRGYLDTPLAPVIAANVVAMIGNHTDNSKVKKVSELMLLGAADATVQSFNLDKIIDDVLAGIKLPAGFLDADDN